MLPEDAVHGPMVGRSGSTGETSVRSRLAVPAVREISRAQATPFILKHHYSKTVPTSDNIFFGCFVDGRLIAVANYGRLASRTPRGDADVAHITQRPDATTANTLELRRLCREGEKGEPGPVKMSDFLRECHELLAMYGDYRYILSYSDQQFNKFAVQFKRAKHKSGGVYKHAGFEWLGETAEEWHLKDADGNRFHRSRAYRRMLAHNLKLCAEWKIDVPRKETGNRDREWPQDPNLWATDASLPPDKLWTLKQVRESMGFTRERRPPKDKWLLTL